MRGASAAALAAGEAVDDDAEERDNGVDDGLNTCGNGVDNGHDAVADGAEDRLDLLGLLANTSRNVRTGDVRKRRRRPWLRCVWVDRVSVIVVDGY